MPWVIGLAQSPSRSARSSPGQARGSDGLAKVQAVFEQAFCASPEAAEEWVIGKPDDQTATLPLGDHGCLALDVLQAVRAHEPAEQRLVGESQWRRVSIIAGLEYNGAPAKHRQIIAPVAKAQGVGSVQGGGHNGAADNLLDKVFVKIRVVAARRLILGFLFTRVCGRVFALVFGRVLA